MNTANTSQEPVTGMLYLVDVRLIEKGTSEVTKHKLLMVGKEAADIDRKARWLFDASSCTEFSITAVEKIRDKVHFLSTSVTQAPSHGTQVIHRAEGTTAVPGAVLHTEKYDPNLYAVGVITSVLAKDPEHALRKVGNALAVRGLPGKSHSAPVLSEDSKVSVEQIPKCSGYAKPRDVSSEVNKPHFVRG